MTPGGKGIEIHGCAVASDTTVADYPFLDQKARRKHLKGTARSSTTSGVNMLKALAKAAGCTVKGAIDAQRGNTIQYNGLYVVVQPNGLFDVRQGYSGKIVWK